MTRAGLTPSSAVRDSDAAMLSHFHWSETRAVLEGWAAEVDLRVHDRPRDLRGVTADGRLARVQPPFVQPIEDGLATAEEYLAELAPALGLHVVVLMQAGASVLGLWRDDALLRHRSIKKYVVRGRGKAQTTYLKTKGKSRYGSRLRLAQAKELLEETGQLLTEWARGEGGFRAVYYSCPVRNWTELFKCRTPPPFAPGELYVRKIPLDVDRPSHEELLRVREVITRGRVVIEEELIRQGA